MYTWQGCRQAHCLHSLCNPRACQGLLAWCWTSQDAHVGALPRPFSYLQMLEKHCIMSGSSHAITVVEMHVVSWKLAQSNPQIDCKLFTSGMDWNSSSAFHSDSLSLYFASSSIPSCSRNLLMPWEYIIISISSHTKRNCVRISKV